MLHFYTTYSWVKTTFPVPYMIFIMQHFSCATCGLCDATFLVPCVVCVMPHFLFRMCSIYCYISYATCVPCIGTFHVPHVFCIALFPVFSVLLHIISALWCRHCLSWWKFLHHSIFIHGDPCVTCVMLHFLWHMCSLYCYGYIICATCVFCIASFLMPHVLSILLHFLYHMRSITTFPVTHVAYVMLHFPCHLCSVYCYISYATYVLCIAT